MPKRPRDVKSLAKQIVDEPTGGRGVHARAEQVDTDLLGPHTVLTMSNLAVLGRSVLVLIA